MQKCNYKYQSILTPLLAALMLSGCATQSGSPIISARSANGPMGPEGSAAQTIQSHPMSQSSTFTGSNILDADDASAEGRTVYFPFAEHGLTKSAKHKLQSTIHLLTSQPGKHLRIAGYADPIGSDKYNYSLSQRRANAVYDYLKANGVGDAQLCTVAYGSSKAVLNPDALKNVHCEFSGKNIPQSTPACIKALQPYRKAVMLVGATC